MMKKLLIFMLVLGLCNAAFATLAIQPILSGTVAAPVTEITVTPSEIFYIDLMWINDFAEGFGPPGELSGADIHVLIAGPATIVDIGSLTFNADYIPAAGVYNGSLPLPNGVILSVTSWSNGANPGEVIIDHIGIHCDDLGDVTISTAVGGEIQGMSIVDWTYPLDPGMGGPGVDPTYTMTVHQIPEPMTVLLLGLGGLFLRRRK